MTHRTVAVGILFAALALGCGLGDDPEAQAPPPEPMALILPPWLMGTWEMVQVEDTHPVVRIPCDDAVLTVEVRDGGHIIVGRGDDRAELIGTALTIEDDGGLTIDLQQGGRIRVEDTTDPGIIRMKGGHRLLSEGVRLASVDDVVVEHLHEPVDRCGPDALDLGALAPVADRDFNSDGDPCMASGLRLSTTGSTPVLIRSDIRYRVVASTPGAGGIWLTVEDDAGRLHGMRLDLLDGGAVRIWQRGGDEMAHEVLLPVQGTCAR
ncbi:MAG: hypothetical protein D6798_14340 [Deltaproteobacteria bacterium]|nr:MAG: hypothetical protein D6798_14340 [Deltaproteobacteria bacterium]